MSSPSTPARPRGDFAATLVLAAPIVAANLSQTLMTMTDVAMVGRLSREALAGMSLGFNLYFLFAMAGVGLMGAVAPIMARDLGARTGDSGALRRTAAAATLAAVALAVPATLALRLGAPILRALGEPASAAAVAGDYLDGLGPSLLPTFAVAASRGGLAAFHRPGASFLAGAIGVAVNALLDWALIFGRFGAPALGVYGSGLATTLSSLVVAAISVGAFAILPDLAERRVFSALARPGEKLGELLRVGLPIAGTTLLETGLFSASTFLMGYVGETALAAHAVALQVATFAFMVPLGVGQAATVRVGRAHGAGDVAAVRRAGAAAYAIGIGFMATTALAMWLAPGALASLFVDRSAPGGAAVAATAAGFLAMAALFQIADGAQAVGVGLLRGLHDTLAPMAIAFVGYWLVGLPLAAWLGLATPLAGKGVWLGLAAGLAFVAAALGWRWKAETK
ncbi:MAG: MATE family efflux transporter [Hyphomicrobiales bacterium]|nr:MATE family efflux transporter [Hyphomicrobiales bacterium]